MKINCRYLEKEYHIQPSYRRTEFGSAGNPQLKLSTYFAVKLNSSKMEEISNFLCIILVNKD